MQHVDLETNAKADLSFGETHSQSLQRYVRIGGC
jgi:hypothetical protein